jgi:integrase
MSQRYGNGSLFKRGSVYYFQYFEDGKQRQVSTRCDRLDKAKKFRDQLLGKKLRGDLNHEASKVTCDELLDDLINHSQTAVKDTTARIWKWCIEANVRPFFGHLKAATLTTEHLREYRSRRTTEGRSDVTVNRELSILRIALNLGRKSTPPKVDRVPWFPMVKEDNARQGFLTDDQYAKLRDALPDDLRPLFVTAYFTGVRLGELVAWQWEQVDWEQGFVTLRADATKSGHSRAVPILKGDMRQWLEWARANADGCDSVFHRNGNPIKSFRRPWLLACDAAGVPDLKFHDLRRTAVRNMRRAGVPQVVRMRISGHRTDSMERRYNIVDVEDLRSAKELMERSKPS